MDSSPLEDGNVGLLHTEDIITLWPQNYCFIMEILLYQDILEDAWLGTRWKMGLPGALYPSALK